MSERFLACHDRGGTQMERPPPLCPQVAIYGLADKRMREGNPPARRSLPLEQDSRPLGLAERRCRGGRVRHRGCIGERAVFPEHRCGRHEVARVPRERGQPGTNHLREGSGRAPGPVGSPQRFVGQLGEQRAGQQGVAARIPPQPAESTVGEPAPPEDPAQRFKLVHVKSAERKPGGAAIAADEALPSFAELRHSARSAREDHEHAIGAEPPAGKEQGTRRRQVHPLQVLDHHRDRLAVRQGGDEGQ